MQNLGFRNMQIVMLKFHACNAEIVCFERHYFCRYNEIFILCVKVPVGQSSFSTEVFFS